MIYYYGLIAQVMLLEAHSDQVKIGQFIKDLRESRFMTQEEFSEVLGTSQSAIARMEKGEQNFTTEMLSKISQALNHKVVTLAPASVDFKITGGRPLSGTIKTNTSKNGAMGLLCGALLNRGKTILHGIPRIEEVYRIIEVLESIEVSVRWTDKSTLEIVPPKEYDLTKINVESAIKTRTILMFIGPLIHRLNHFNIPHAQGCKLGKRTASGHIFALEELGVKIKVTRGNYEVSVGKLRSREIVMFESGDTACENVLMAAAKIPGKTVIKFATPNYMVQEVCFFLEKCGVKIEGIGSTTLIVHGVADIDDTIEYSNSEDPIETMMFLSTAICTQSEITITHCPIDFLELELYKLEKMGFKYKKSKVYKSENGQTNLVDITTYPSRLKALDEKIYGRPYPGINIDNLPFFVPIAAMAEGTTLIHDWVFENRALYYMELAKLGAEMILADPHRVFVTGPNHLKAAQVVCPPALRPAMIVLIGMLAAEGTSVLRSVYSISRGYEEIAERLNSLGAKIEVIREM
jgi:UDP-N-acetylglucosamine 1-carboxyvinyltransferase